MTVSRTRSSSPEIWRLIPLWMKLGAVGVFLVLLSIPVIPWLIGVPNGATAEQPVMDELPERGRGAYLQVSDGGSAQLLKLFTWSIQPERFPAEASVINPAHFEGIFISQKGLDVPEQYMLFNVVDESIVPVEAEIVEFQHQLRLVPVEPLDPGEYQIVIPTGGMFAGHEYYYFRIDPAVKSLPISAAEVTGSAAEPTVEVDSRWLEIFPLSAVIVSLLAAGVLLNRSRERVRVHELAWVVAFLLFAIAATSQVVADLTGWTSFLAKTYYISGATLVVGWLGLGTWLLLVRRRSLRIAGVGSLVFLTGFGLGLITLAPVKSASLSVDGWRALDKPIALTLLTVGVNSIGTIILVGGALWTAWKFRRQGIMRDRMIGCIYLAVGALIIAFGGTLTRLGHDQYFYFAVAVGVLVMFLGYLRTIKPLQPLLQNSDFDFDATSERASLLSANS